MRCRPTHRTAYSGSKEDVQGREHLSKEDSMPRECGAPAMQLLLGRELEWQLKQCAGLKPTSCVDCGFSASSSDAMSFGFPALKMFRRLSMASRNAWICGSRLNIRNRPLR